MRMGRTVLLGLSILGLTVGVLSAQGEGGNPEAAKLKNPVPSAPESIMAGETIYQRRCRGCHGRDGSGGPPKEAGDAPAANLTDDKWDHGSTDGEIFWVIKHGVSPALVMEPWEDRLSDTDIWNVVNYLRTLPAKAKQ